MSHVSFQSHEREEGFGAGYARLKRWESSHANTSHLAVPGSGPESDYIEEQKQSAHWGSVVVHYK